MQDTATQQAAPQSFAALRHPGYRAYFAGSALAMMADSIEHVISYWIMFQKFHSPALGGFAMLSHWLPFLFFSVYSGALADRYDPRRLIQLGMLMFMISSLGWGLLFLTPDIVGTAQLQSAVRLGATARYLGLLFGPAVGGALLLVLGPAYGLLVNMLIYLPLLVWLWKAPYGPRFRKEKAPLRAVRGLADVVSTFRDIAGNRAIVSMVMLAGLTSLFVGNGYQPQMPEFAADLGHEDPDLSYSMLLAADAAGALTA